MITICLCQTTPGFASSIQPALDGKPYTQLMYANGPGFKYHKIVTFPNGSFQEVPRKNISNSEGDWIYY